MTDTYSVYINVLFYTSFIFSLSHTTLSNIFSCQNKHDSVCWQVWLPHYYITNIEPVEHVTLFASIKHVSLIEGNKTL